LKPEDVKDGMKVVPFQKTAGEGNLKGSHVWTRGTNGDFVQHHEYGTVSGDYFDASDFEPYVEPDAATKAPRSPSQRIRSVHIGRKTSVELSDGRVGTALCDPRDTYNPVVGVTLAYMRALGPEVDDIQIIINPPKPDTKLKKDCMEFITPAAFEGHGFTGRIAAIKLYRERTGKGLREAKDQIDAWIEEARK
jgi:hypothetical protein